MIIIPITTIIPKRSLLSLEKGGGKLFWSRLTVLTVPCSWPRAVGSRSSRSGRSRSRSRSRNRSRNRSTEEYIGVVVRGGGGVVVGNYMCIYIYIFGYIILWLCDCMIIWTYDYNWDSSGASEGAREPWGSRFSMKREARELTRVSQPHDSDDPQ